MHVPDPPEQGQPGALVAGLVLAGGLSGRLGQPKQLLPFGDGTLLEHAIAEVEAVAALSPIVVVLPPGDAIPDPRTSRARIVRRAREGSCSASLLAGLDALPRDPVAVAVLPADQPKLDRDAIALAVDVWLRDRPPALTLSHGGEFCHPLIFSAGLFGMLRTLRGEKGMWHMLEEMGNTVQRVEIHRPVTFDIDTWEDYLRLTQMSGDTTAD